MAAQPGDLGSDLRRIELLIEHLRALRHDPNAIRVFDLMAGGFVWSDEKPGPNAIRSGKKFGIVISGGETFRYLIGYRASPTIGKPREKLRSVWDAVRKDCPDWPGFRADRFSEGLAEELHSENVRAMRRFDALDRLYNREAKKRNRRKI